MFDWVPDPVCHTTRGNWSSHLPLATFARRLFDARREIVVENASSRALTRAAACLTSPRAWTSGSGMCSGPDREVADRIAASAPPNRPRGVDVDRSENCRSRCGWSLAAPGAKAALYRSRSAVGSGLRRSRRRGDGGRCRRRARSRRRTAPHVAGSGTRDQRDVVDERGAVGRVARPSKLSVWLPAAHEPHRRRLVHPRSHGRGERAKRPRPRCRSASPGTTGSPP